jgi:predicted GNAT superfamily acetyltransferase
METVIFQTAKTEADLLGILELQSENHLEQISSTEEGFVTVKHDLQLLKKMNELAPHVIAKVGEKVVAYVLAMTQASKEDIPILIPMFEQFNALTFRSKPLYLWNYLVVGQVCVGKNFRGQGIFEKMYAYYKTTYEKEFDFAVTEIAINNPRSIRAHQKLGFKEIHRFTDDLPMDWIIVLWDWK